MADKTIAFRGEFKGNLMLKIGVTEQDKYPFSFGLTKAKLILAHIKDIEAFVAEVEASKPTEVKVAVK